MIAVDTKILVYAHRRDSEWHPGASAAIRRLAEGAARWAIPWPCIWEFISIATHPRIYTPPSTLEQALNQVDAWSESPALVLLSEAPATWGMFRDSVAETRVIGARLHDARVAAICLLHGVRELLTADRDFSRFTGLATRNPLLPSGHE